jgi:hypothetical protein
MMAIPKQIEVNFMRQKCFRHAYPRSPIAILGPVISILEPKAYPPVHFTHGPSYQLNVSLSNNWPCFHLKISNL